MLKRTLTSLVLISIIGIVIFSLPVWVFTIVLSIFIYLGIYEFFRLDPKNEFPNLFRYVGTFAGFLLPYLTYFYWDAGSKGEALFFITVLISLFLIQWTRRENHNAIMLIAVTLFGVFYIAWFLTFLLKIRFLEDGSNLVAYLLLVTKTGDIGAYLIGSRFGKHPLIPRISPNKSVEGAIGGFLFSLFFAILGKIYLLTWMPVSAILISGVLIGIFAQLGDLAESLIKRDYNVKDSSILFPGLGGMLDVLDSLLFTTPIFYIYLLTPFSPLLSRAGF